MKDNLKQLIIKYLESEGGASKSRIEDYMKELKGTTGDCVSRRLRELVASGVCAKIAREFDGKKYFAYRVAKVEVPIIGTVNSETEEIIFKQNQLL